MKIFSGKKGVSPIIATVLLIAFAVSLGAVVMNWGKTISEKEEVSDSLKWYLGSNIENVCYDDNSIIFNIKGDPVTNIKATALVARGNDQDFVSPTPVEIPPEGQVNKITVPFDISKYGALNQIIFYAIDTAITREKPARC